MGVHKMTKIQLVAAIGLTALVVNQFSATPKDYVRLPRTLSSADKSSFERSYSAPGSIAAVINTAKMGTGGLDKTFLKSWKCKSRGKVNTVSHRSCTFDRHSFRTHVFEPGVEYIQKHREENPDAQCIIATAIRSPAAWFGSMYLQTVHDNWKPKEEMVQDYREFLATDDFQLLFKALPGLLHEFDAGTLTEQAKIIDANGGYSLTPAPPASTLAGCDLLLLRMEQSDQWPSFFEMLDPEFENIRGTSRVDRHMANVDQINAIASYELTSEEKVNIYNRDSYIQDWFDAYGYMDGVTLIKPSTVKSYSSPRSIAAVINTAKMGTGGLDKTFQKSWKCILAPTENSVNPSFCKKDRRSIRTHSFDAGIEYILEHRKEHLNGKCLIATAIRSPASWFGSMYLQTVHGKFKSKEEMLQDYREFLATDDFHMIYLALPGLLHEFGAGTLTQQAKIMDDNGGYSLIPAPPSSMLAGCDLFFLRMEESDQWPEFFEMLDPEFKLIRGASRVDQHKKNVEQINAIASYELTSEEKINIYNTGNKFLQDWFDAYEYMDDVGIRISKTAVII